MGISAVLEPRIDRMMDFPLTQVLAGLALAATFEWLAVLTALVLVLR
ncbi:MAG: hypothetical protein WAM94_06365 [Chromatiaceae bacterium]